MPDSFQESLKFSPRTVSRLDEEHEEASDWSQTLRPVDYPQSRSFAHSRDASIEKAFQPPPPLPLTSPRAHAAHSRVGPGFPPDRSIDSKTAIYGHHRQTSIVHGFQHSRNGSIASSTSSPLSPMMIVAAGAGFERPDLPSVAVRLETDVGHFSRPPTAMKSRNPSPNGLSQQREPRGAAVEPSGVGAVQRRVDRMQSRTRTGHAQKSSHSSRQDPKTVGEYALHVLFTSVSAYTVYPSALVIAF